MKIGPQTAPTTGISGSNADTIVVRGYDLAAELIGKISFSEYTWLLIAGTRPNASQLRLFDATLVAIAEHGLVPSVAAARMTLAASPESIQGAVAAGVLGCGSVILGAAEAAGRLFDGIAARATNGEDVHAAAREVIREYRANKRAIPGYGHPVHKEHDARAAALINLATELGVAGRTIAIARAVEDVIPEVTGKNLRINVSGAIPSVLLDAGYPLLALKGVPLLARTASLIGHLLEEQMHPIGFTLADSGARSVAYDGPAPAGFVANAN
jgi:citrate synthase